MDGRRKMEHPKFNELYLIALFPGFFVFHALHSIGIIPYAGWFSITITLGTLIILSSYLINVRKTPSQATVYITDNLPALLFFLYCIIFTVSMHLFSNSSYITTEGLIWNLTNILQLIGFYLIGLRLEIKITKSTALLIALSYLSFIVVTYAFYIPLNATIILPVPSPDSVSKVASYQSMAMCVLYMCLTFCFFIKIRKIKTLVLLCSLPLLYFIGARAEFFLLATILPFYIYINYSRKSFFAISISMTIAVIVAVSTINFNARFTSTLSELGAESPRTKLMKSGIDGIANSPILGDYLGQVRDSGSVGAYIHNALSVYQQFGILGFSAYALLTISALVIGLSLIGKAKTNPRIEILIYTSIISIVGVAVSKSIGWPLPALAWGIASSLQSRVEKQPPKAITETDTIHRSELHEEIKIHEARQ